MRIFILIITLAIVFSKNNLEASSISEFLSTKITEYAKKLGATRSTYSKSAELRGDEYGQSVYVESGSGYGHSKGYGHSNSYGSHGAITLDPVSIISLLALGAFLINNILQLLRANQAMATGRSLNVVDLNVPLDQSDIAPNYRVLNETQDNSPNFGQFFANVGSLYYLQPQKRNICIKKVVCNYMSAQQSRQQENEVSLKKHTFELMLSTIRKLVAPELNENDRFSKDFCEKFNRVCSDSLLQDAKSSAEKKVFSTMSTLVTNFAIKHFLSV